jgi:CheY-like chemotaxis protein
MAMLNILVVDDIYTNRYLLSELIRLTGNEPVIAENGEQAIEILKSQEIDMIFMDIEMPVMNGIEATRYIRKKLNAPLNTVPIIALTAHSPEIFFEDYADIDFDELVTKPYSVEKIRARINELGA